MNIDNTNFNSHLELVLDAIRSSEFISFDTEFTGKF